MTSSPTSIDDCSCCWGASCGVVADHQEYIAAPMRIIGTDRPAQNHRDFESAAMIDRTCMWYQFSGQRAKDRYLTDGNASHQESRWASHPKLQH